VGEETGEEMPVGEGEAGLEAVGERLDNMREDGAGGRRVVDFRSRQTSKLICRFYPIV